MEEFQCEVQILLGNNCPDLSSQIKFIVLLEFEILLLELLVKGLLVPGGYQIHRK